MAKNGEITITYHPDKIGALNAAYLMDGLSFADELTKYVAELYTEKVSDEVQFLIAINLGEEPPPIKEKKKRKNKAAPGKQEGVNDNT